MNQRQGTEKSIDQCLYGFFNFKGSVKEVCQALETILAEAAKTKKFGIECSIYRPDREGCFPEGLEPQLVAADIGRALHTNKVWMEDEEPRPFDYAIKFRMNNTPQGEAWAAVSNILDGLCIGADPQRGQPYEIVRKDAGAYTAKTP